MKKIILLTLFTLIPLNVNAGMNINFDKLYDTNSNEIICENTEDKYLLNELCNIQIEPIKLKENIAEIKTNTFYQINGTQNKSKDSLKFFNKKYPHINDNKEISNSFVIEKRDRVEQINSTPENKIYLYYFGTNISNEYIFKKVIFSEKYGSIHKTLKIKNHQP